MLEHTTPASSLCPQLCTFGPLCGQENRSVSLPVHRKLSSQIVPLPWPNVATLGALTAVPNPSCLHATLASFILQRSSQTVPHSPLKFTSTLPSLSVEPPMSPARQMYVCNVILPLELEQTLSPTLIVVGHMIPTWPDGVHWNLVLYHKLYG